MKISACRLIELPEITDERGSLSVVEGLNHIPFAIKRVYYIYNTPPGAERGGLTYRNSEQILIAISGSFTVSLDDGINTASYTLNSPKMALYIPEMIWREVSKFSDNAICLVISSTTYENSNIIRDYQEFTRENIL